MTQELGVNLRRWINVEEHLPEDHRKVLVCGRNSGPFSTNSDVTVSIGSFNPRKGWHSTISEIYCWTEMPKLPISLESENEDDDEED